MSTVVALIQDPILRFTDNAGNPLVGGSLLTQVGSSNYPTYSESTGTVPLPNPIPLNNRGEISTAAGASSPLFVSPNVAYTYTLADSSGNIIWSAPNIISPSTVNAVIAGLTPAVVGSALYPQSASEITAGVTPTNYQYPYGDPRRYGADPSGSADATTAVQAAITVQSLANGAVWIGDGCTYLTGSLTWQASGTNAGISIVGANKAGSQLKFTGTSGIHLLLSGAASDIANNVVTLAHVYCENFTLVGQGNGIANTSTGIQLFALAQFYFNNVEIVNYQTGFSILSALVGDFYNCIAVNCQTGYLSAQSGSNEACNDISIREGRIIGNTTWGIDIGGGQGWTIDGVDIESNGTIGNASSGGIIIRSTANVQGLSIFDIRAWIEQNHGWSIYAESNTVLILSVQDRLITTTADSTFTGSISGTALTTSGGAPAIGQYISGAGVTPGTQIQSGSGTSWAVNISQSVSSTAMSALKGGAIFVVNGFKVSIKNVQTGSQFIDTIVLNAASATLDEVSFASYNDTGVTYPYYTGVNLNGGVTQDGRVTSQAVTMSGGSTATGTFTVFQQGHAVTVLNGAQIANGSGTATTITIANAVPASCYPGSTRSGIVDVLNNGGVTWGTWSLSTTGTLTLTNNAGNFTNAVTNGLPAGIQLSYRI